MVASHLTPELWALFTGQQIADQRHGLEAGLRVITAGVDDPDLIVAALVHDVGKSHSRIGVIRRSVATLLMYFRLPMTSRMRLYRDHGKLGAEDLEQAGAPQIAVLFARHHQYGRPPAIDATTWDLLRAADMGTQIG